MWCGSAVGCGSKYVTRTNEPCRLIVARPDRATHHQQHWVPPEQRAAPRTLLGQKVTRQSAQAQAQTTGAGHMHAASRRAHARRRTAPQQRPIDDRARAATRITAGDSMISSESRGCLMRRVE